MAAARSYVAPPLPDYGICRFSGKPRRPTSEQMRDEQRARIEALTGTDRPVCFCTNTMLDRGTVYRCYIDADGNAVAFEKYGWWAMSFSETTPDNTNLGPVKAQQVSGSLCYTLVVGRYTEGTG